MLFLIDLYFKSIIFGANAPGPGGSTATDCGAHSDLGVLAGRPPQDLWGVRGAASPQEKKQIGMKTYFDWYQA